MAKCERRSVGQSERLRLTIEQIASVETCGRILPTMLPSHGYQGFRSAPPPSGWVQMGGGWLLRWGGRQVAHVSPSQDGDARVHMDVRKMWQKAHGS